MKKSGGPHRVPPEPRTLVVPSVDSHRDGDMEQPYDVIYTDPPWSYSVAARKGAIKQYDKSYRYLTMSWKELESMVLPLTDEGVAFVWTTMPCLPYQLDVIRAWGLTNVRIFRIWIKRTRIQGLLFKGVGFYTASNAELLLIASKKAKDVTRNAPQSRVFNHIRLEHSCKPPSMREEVVGFSPDSTRLEMFARTATDARFDYHGDQKTLLNTTASTSEQKRVLKSNAVSHVCTNAEKHRQPLKRKHSVAFVAERRLDCYHTARIVLVDIDLRSVQQVDLRPCFERNVFVVMRLDPNALRESIACFDRWNTNYKTVMFVVIDPEDTTFFQLWGVATTSSTRIKECKVRHVSSVIERREPDNNCLTLVQKRIETVFGTECSKVVVSSEHCDRTGWLAIGIGSGKRRFDSRQRLQ